MVDTNSMPEASRHGMERPPTGFTAELVGLLGCSLLLVAVLGLSVLLDSSAL